MADFFKGLAGGFGTGLQFGQAMQDRQERERQLQMRDALAQEAGRYGVTEGAYGPGLQENIQQLQGLREQDPTQAPAYDQAIAELTRRQGLTAPDYSVASGPTNFATRQEARQAAAPMRTEGLAGVYRQFGDVTKADELEARAFEQQRAIAREARDVEQFGLTKKEAGLRIGEGERAAAEQKSISDAREKLQALRKDGPLTAAAISSVAGEFKLDPIKFLQAEDAVNTLEIKDLKRNLSSAALKGEDGLNKFLADKFDPDKTDNIKPMITKAKDGSFVVTYGDRVLQEYGAHKNMMSLVGGVINLIDQNPFDTLKTLSTLETQAAARDASRASAAKDVALGGLYAQGGKGAGKPSATESLVDQAKKLVGEGVYKDTATAIEALKKGSARDADKEVWLKAEQKLIESDATPEAINAQRTAFFVRRGYAPAAARQVLETGINPTTGKPLTKADVDAYNATYPQTPVDLGSLPWLQSPEREAKRQGLISQIPK